MKTYVLVSSYIFFFVSYKRNNENILVILKRNVSFCSKLVLTDFQIFFLSLKLNRKARSCLLSMSQDIFCYSDPDNVELLRQKK